VFVEGRESVFFVRVCVFCVCLGLLLVECLNVCLRVAVLVLCVYKCGVFVECACVFFRCV